MSEDDAPGEAQLERRRAAIAWWMRLDSGATTPAEREAFAAWLTAEPANKVAFDDICRLWGDLEILRPRLQPAAKPRPRFTRPGLRAAAAVAGLALALALSYDELSIRWRAGHLTETGELRSLLLEDGSRVELGPDSALETNFAGGERRVTLLRGEAWFAVAPDAARPFSVATPAGTATALGTAFDVSIQGARTEVTVTEHRVRLSGAGPSVIVEEGAQSAFAPGVAAVSPYPVDTDQVTAWRRGKLIFDDKPLAEVLATLSRYRRGYIALVDPSLRGRRVTGVFETRDPEAALRAIQKSLGLRAVSLGFVTLIGG
ncbi:FecR family protein [Methylosinus sporium]|uniref:Iron dicitrate transport regulator FecR n=1 Tax=Methylosinus sporium TaxID=428 RepID=A0A2U1SPC0_METSR|nr:FecR family protein [Methylosinus sporium]PWB93461.1 iron dicitrate transport regulator FecR [Methylosinus sporium]